MPPIPPAPAVAPLQIQSGVECTINRVEDQFHTRLDRSGHLDRDDELERARDAGVLVPGACPYPAFDRPDWNEEWHWHNSGLWYVGQSSTEQRPRRCRDRADDAACPASRLCEESAPGSAPAARAAGRQRRQAGLDRLLAPALEPGSRRAPRRRLTRLARRVDIVFVEAPVDTDGPANLERAAPCLGVELLGGHGPIDAGGSHGEPLVALQRMLASYLAENLINDHVV